MAIIKAKREKKQLAIGIRQFAKSTSKTTKTKQKQSAAHRPHGLTLPKSRRTWFPQTNGRVVKQVEFFSDTSNNTLELTFADDTSLSFEFKPAFIWEAYFAKWKSGEQRILHRWPRKSAVLR